MSRERVVEKYLSEIRILTRGKYLEIWRWRRPSKTGTLAKLVFFVILTQMLGMRQPFKTFFGLRQQHSFVFLQTYQ